MVRKRTIFDEDWLMRARLRRADASWADEVMATVETNGGIYLESLRLWFDRFPLSSKQKHALATRLESLDKKDHLGAVNELAWWAFMHQEGMNAAPVPTSATPRPDFQVIAPAECFVEVSTLNVSDRDKSTFAGGESVELDHSQTSRRILSKVTNEKRRQLSYATGRKVCWFSSITQPGASLERSSFAASETFCLGSSSGFILCLPSCPLLSMSSGRYIPTVA